MTATSGQLESTPSVGTGSTGRPTGAGEHAGLVVIERHEARDGAGPALPLWNTVLANAPLSRFYQCLFTDAGAGWAATLLPEEHVEVFAANRRPDFLAAPISYNGQLTIPPELLARGGRGGAACIILSGRFFPMCDLRQVIHLHGQGGAEVTVVTARDPRAHRYEEKLLVGADGRVQCVNRCYDEEWPAPLEKPGPGWPAVMVLSPAAAQRMAGIVLPQRLAQWPEAMLGAGLRLHEGVVPGRCFDLHDRDPVHELADALLRERAQWLAQAAGLIEHRPKVWIGRNVRIGRDAQIIGPVAIGDGVHIGDEALIVGPAAIGFGSRIGAGVVLRRCLLPPGSEVESPALLPISAAIDRPIRLQTVFEAPRMGGFHHRAYLFTKRAMDIVGAVLFLVLTAPLYPLIAAAIRLSSPGPVFYGHVRQGRGGRNFKCWKFRTMVPDADRVKEQLVARNEVDGPQFKIREDPRVFWVGRWLRRLNIDEWPQFLNVLKGEMSLVGPRPSPAVENQMCPAWRDARLSVRPGITGLWQVYRRRELETDFQEWIYYDVQYVKRQSIWLDLKILLRTVTVAMKGS